MTLLELLAVIAIISILVALVLPAVQQAREAARRTHCRSNIRQLVMALHAYHDRHQLLPLNYGNGPYSDLNSGASWMQMVLPEIEQSALYNQIQFGEPLAHPANIAVAETPLPVITCPSDTHSGRMPFRANVPGEWALNNYKACAGSNWDWGAFSPVVTTRGRNAGNPNGLDFCTGVICRGGSLRTTTTRLRDIRDGTSTTFAIGEAVPEWSRHTWWWWFNATTATCAIPLNHKREPDLQDEMEGDWWHNYSFLSRHAGGAHFGMADGSARFVSDNIDLGVYRALGTIQAGEAVGTNW